MESEERGSQGAEVADGVSAETASEDVGAPAGDGTGREQVGNRPEQVEAGSAEPEETRSEVPEEVVNFPEKSEEGEIDEDLEGSDPIEIELDLDKPRTLCFDSNAMEDFEAKAGRRIIHGDLKAQKVADLALFLWACTNCNDDRPTLETVQKHMYLYQMGEIFDLIFRLMGRMRNDPDFLAPYVPTPQIVMETALDLVELEYGETLWDLGCGDGRFLRMAVKRKGAKAVGVEMLPKQLGMARQLIDDLGDRAEVREGKIQDHLNDPDFPEADVVVVYLLSYSNVRLAQDLKAKMKPGSRLVSVDFEFRDWAGKYVRLEDERKRPRRIFVYNMPPVLGESGEVELPGEEEKVPETTEG